MVDLEKLERNLNATGFDQVGAHRDGYVVTLGPKGAVWLEWDGENIAEALGALEDKLKVVGYGTRLYKPENAPMRLELK